jgi:hypothetical protein
MICLWCGLPLTRGADGFTGVRRWLDADGVSYCVDARHFHEPITRAHREAS